LALRHRVIDNQDTPTNSQIRTGQSQYDIKIVLINC
jgi:hypothetical protein